MLRRFCLFITLILAAAPALAQPTPAAPPEPSIRRWLDVQTLTLYTRYRYIESNKNIVSSDDQQYRETIRLRFNADARKRYTANVGFSSGNNFIGSWDNTGWGANAHDVRSHTVKQLYASAIPVAGFEFQMGGLFVSRGESTEYTSYDDDGYLMGERVSVRRPKQIYFDEISVTQAALAHPKNTNVFDRFVDLRHQQYTQVLASKRFSPMVAGSGDFTRQAGTDTLRGALALRFKPTAPLTAVRFESYYRFDAAPAGGFSLGVERPITKWVRLQGGYVTIDEHYANVGAEGAILNSDRIQRGRRVFALANVAIHGPLSGAIFISEALHAPYTVSNRTRFDAILQYDLLARLRSARKL